MATLPSERAGTAATVELLEKRLQFTDRGYDGSIPLTEVELESVPCRVLDGGDVAVVLYLHGGGYRMGSAAAYTEYGMRLAHAAGAKVVLADYRLAPESPFPAAVRDSVAAYLAVRSEYPDLPIVVAGDSAGGGLAAAVSSAMASAGAAGPDGLALLSPWLDLRCDSPTYASATDPLFDLETARSARESYLQGHDNHDPLASPMRAEAHVFPQTFIQVGTTESLLGDSLTFVNNLVMAGVSCQLHVVADQGHTWPLIEPSHPDSRSAVDNFGHFVRQIADAARRN